MQFWRARIVIIDEAVDSKRFRKHENMQTARGIPRKVTKKDGAAVSRLRVKIVFIDEAVYIFS